ncbi:MAG: IS110 family transposase, partial [Paramuribaculum sp.]|nr:IS110 family transposase [Paramuribaculum sp.]
KNEIKSDDSINTNYELLTSIPGIGLVNAIVTIISTGNFTRFQTARQYAKFTCVSPLSNQSGTSIRGGDHVSHAGHSEIKSLLTEGALSAVHNDAQLKAYYERKRAQGKSHGCVMNAVKFKLICRMFAVIGRQRAYVNTEGYRN